MVSLKHNLATIFIDDLFISCCFVILNFFFELARALSWRCYFPFIENEGDNSLDPHDLGTQDLRIQVEVLNWHLARVEPQDQQPFDELSYDGDYNDLVYDDISDEDSDNEVF